MASNFHVNSSICPKIDWLSSLPASLMKVRSKMKLPSSGKKFPKSMGPSRAGKSHVNN